MTYLKLYAMSLKGNLFIRCFFFMAIGCMALTASGQDTLWYFEGARPDLGRISKEQFPIVHHFRFLNGGQQPMKVTRVDADCACSVAEFSKAPIAPGEYGQIDVIFRPYKPGPFKKTFTVYASGIYPSRMEIALNGYIAPFSFEPSLEFPHTKGALRFRNRQVVLGNITNQVPIKKRVEVYNPTSSVLTLSDSVVSPPYIEVVFEEDRAIKPKEVNSFTLFYHPELKNDFGEVKDLLIFHEEGSMQKAFELPVSASIKQYFTPEERFDPERPQLYIPSPVLRLGRITLTDSMTVDFELKNTGEKDLIIQKIVANYGCEAVPLASNSIAPDGTVVLTMNILDINKKGKQDRSLIIYCTDPINTTQKVKVTLDVR